MRALATLLIVVAPLTAAAQGVVRGTVRNKDGAPISGASNVPMIAPRPWIICMLAVALPASCFTIVSAAVLD